MGISVTITQPIETYIRPSSKGRDGEGGREEEGELTSSELETIFSEHCNNIETAPVATKYVGRISIIENQHNCILSSFTELC